MLCKFSCSMFVDTFTHKVGKFDLALYTHPQPKREPLTDEQIAEFFGVKAVDESFVDFVRAIEAAHGIKENT